MYARIQVMNNSCFRRQKLIDCFVALMKENLERIWRSVLNVNCTLTSLVYDWKVWEFWPKYKIDFMLRVFNLAVCVFEKNSDS